MAIVSVPHGSHYGAVDVFLTYDDGTGQLLSVDLKARRFAMVTVTVANLAGKLLKQVTRVLNADRQRIDVKDLALTVSIVQTVKGHSWQLNAVVGVGGPQF